MGRGLQLSRTSVASSSTSSMHEVLAPSSSASCDLSQGLHAAA